MVVAVLNARSAAVTLSFERIVDGYGQTRTVDRTAMAEGVAVGALVLVAMSH